MTDTTTETTPVKIRRGDLVVIELRPTYTTTGNGVTRSDEVTEYALTTVTNLTRDGRIKRVRDDRWSGDATVDFDRMLYRTGRFWILPKADWDTEKANELAKDHTYPNSTTPRCFPSLETARKALRPARRDYVAPAVEEVAPVEEQVAVAESPLVSAQEAAVISPDLTAYPDSAVPAAFDRGHLYSPTITHLAWALDPGYAYDYRPGNDFEPMPDAPHGDGKARAWWWNNVAKNPVPDFLGLRAGDEITIHHVSGPPGRATVLATYRHHAVIRYPMPAGAREPYAETWVNTRNADGHWY